MAKNLLIVESPAKAKTISKFLGSDYVVKASFGHVRDLPKKDVGIDVAHDYAPTYTVSKDPKTTKALTAIRQSVGKGTDVWIATDEDREGEAIGWHLAHILKLDPKTTKRIVFHEITKGAITEALKEPRTLDMKLVDAQQTRRILDRLLGYELSPLLWKKVRPGLSAGRVQSVAVRLVVEKEREIQAFNTEEYWSVTAELAKKNGVTFTAALDRKDGEKLKMGDQATVDGILKDLEGAKYEVADLTKKTVRRKPPAPYTTSSLQQDAFSKLRFSVRKTMMIAQQLYEGLDVGHGEQGLITYMRTDSFNLAKSAIFQAREVIEKRYGKDYVASSPRMFHSKKSAQEAHEAIRPVDLSLAPEMVARHLNSDQARLYELIWQRTMACQMAEAVLDQTGVDVAAGAYTFHAAGQVTVFPGYRKVYVESLKKEDRDSTELPPLEVGEKVDLRTITPEQHFTKPPARYSEASLIKKLESLGIGRPSTYAPTVSTIQARKYVDKDGRNLVPTDVAFVVTDLLVEHFPLIVDYSFTAEMEEDLDRIAEGTKEWLPVIDNFYKPFHSNLESKMESLSRKELTTEKTDKICPKCSKPVVIKLGRFGRFYSCSDYPECKHTEPLEGSGEEAPKELDEKCPDCGKPLMQRRGRFGPFVGCSAYPECKYIKKDVKTTGAKCPKCREREIVERRSKRGKIFFGCPGYPKCDYATWTRPLAEPCPSCGGLLLEGTKKDPNIKCQTEGCGYTRPMTEDQIANADEGRSGRGGGKREGGSGPAPLKDLGKDPEGNPIGVFAGRYGPYVTNGKRVFASIPRDTDPMSVTLPEALRLIADKIESSGGAVRTVRAGKKTAKKKSARKKR